MFAATYLFVALLVVGARRPGYSHIRHTISELGDFGAPQQRLVALGVFLPVGVLLALVAQLLRPFGNADAIFALCISIGYLVAAMFPCDPGSPLWGTRRQALHNLGGAIEYVGGAFALWRIGESLGQPFRAAALIVGGPPSLSRFKHSHRYAASCSGLPNAAFSAGWRYPWQNRGAV